MAMHLRIQDAAHRVPDEPGVWKGTKTIVKMNMYW